MSPRKAQALLRLERAGDLCPELRAAFRGGALSWVQAHALVPILELEHSQPWRAAWVAHAAAISVRRLEGRGARARDRPARSDLALRRSANGCAPHGPWRDNQALLYGPSRRRS